MLLTLGIGFIICVIFLYALCRAAGQADKRMEKILSKKDTSGGGK